MPISPLPINVFLKGIKMYQVWDGELFLFDCIAEEADLYRDEGYTVKKSTKE
jgi:hypothetical protein